MAGVAAQSADQPKLHTHQSDTEAVMWPTTLDVTDRVAVFAFVLDSVPDRIKVYSAETYYYFTFMHNGAAYAGNIRLNAGNRDQGKAQFSYNEQTNGWLDNARGQSRVLDAASGVKLEKLECFRYRLSYKRKNVVFELNNRSQVKPPATVLAPKKKFIGQVFDDFGIRFFLVYKVAINDFFYILNETARVADDFVRD